MIKPSDTNIVSSSANGTAIHIPKTSKNCGSISSATEIKTNVRNVDIIADTFPLDKAVNVAEANILKPQNKKLIGKIRNPCLAIRYTSVPFGEKILTNGEPSSIAIANIKIEIVQIKSRHIRKIFFKRS